MGQRLQALILGQILSLIITGTAFSSTLVVQQGIYAPTAQSFLNYVLLGVVYGSYVLHRQKPLKAPWYLYLLFAFVDLEANYIIVKAYQYTSITSIILLDCWSIPCVLLLTWAFLRARYLPGHFLGVSLCILGLGLAVLSDVHAGDRSGGSNSVLGDTLVLIAATLYAVCNVFEELLVKKVDRAEILALVGVFGSIISACQIFLLEREELKTIQWTAKAILPVLMFASCLFSFATLVPKVLQIGGSTMMNLSLLTSDMYAVAIRVIFLHQSVDWVYFVAFATVSSGIVYYAYSGEPHVDLGDSIVPRKDVVYERIETSTSTSGTDASSDKSGANELSKNSNGALVSAQLFQSASGGDEETV